MGCLILWSLCIGSIFLYMSSTSNLNIDAQHPVVNSNDVDSNALNLNGYGTHINLVINFVNDNYFIVFNKTFQADFENNVLLLTICLDDGVFDKMSAITDGILIHAQLLQYNTLTLNINHIQQCYMRYTFILDNTLKFVLKNKQILNESYTNCKMKGRHCDDQTIDNRTQSNNYNSINIHYLPLKHFCRRNCRRKAGLICILHIQPVIKRWGAKKESSNCWISIDKAILS